MKIIIAGSRKITQKNIIFSAYFQGLANFVEDGCKLPLGNIEIISGGARGVDKIGEELAVYLRLELKVFPADWDKYGKRAGYIRNEEMAKYADALIAIWDGESKGTKHMIELAKKHNLRIYIYNLKE
jgi:hypothetical protein